MQFTETVRWGRLGSVLMLLAACSQLAVGAGPSSPGPAAVQPPPGFTALFNSQDLTGWRGGDTFDHRKLLAMPADQREAQIAKWTQTMKAHWRVEKGEPAKDTQGTCATTDKTTQGAGAAALIRKAQCPTETSELVNDGQGAYATTEKDYGDFELLVDYKTVPLADSGIYLRGCPQVQIWDYTEKAKFPLGADKGSGALWNNSPGAPGKDPLVLADKPFGQWNKVRVLMVGARVSVWLNGKLVVDHALMENYYDRKTPVPPKGPIQLQTHGGEIRWRNIFIREIGSDEANKILASHGSAGFQSVFNGRDFTGWAGPTNNYAVVAGAIQCRPQQGGTLHTTSEYSDFMARVQFKLPPGGNNGLAIRYPGEGDVAYGGMC